MNNLHLKFGVNRVKIIVITVTLPTRFHRHGVKVDIKHATKYQKGRSSCPQQLSGEVKKWIGRTRYKRCGVKIELHIDHITLAKSKRFLCSSQTTYMWSVKLIWPKSYSVPCPEDFADMWSKLTLIPYQKSYLVLLSLWTIYLWICWKGLE